MTNLFPKSTSFLLWSGSLLLCVLWAGCVHRLAENTCCLSLSISTFNCLKQGLSWFRTFLIWGISTSYPPPVLELQECLVIPILVAAGDSNSGPVACITSTVTHQAISAVPVVPVLDFEVLFLSCQVCQS